jgi:hypothetical protein
MAVNIQGLNEHLEEVGTVIKCGYNDPSTESIFLIVVKEYQGNLQDVQNTLDEFTKSDFPETSNITLRKNVLKVELSK